MPARSLGCLTCRKRKIRCDEGRPGCQRCVTHGVSCPGYRTDKPGGIEFKDQTTSTKRRADQQYRVREALRAGERVGSLSNGSASSTFIFERNNSWSDGLSNGSDSVTLASSPSTIDLEDSANEQRALVLSNNKIARPGASTHSISYLHSPNLERATLYSTFIDTYLPWTPQGSQNGHFSFFQTIADRRSSEPALQQGFDALSLVQIGSLYKQPALIRQAVRQYGNALVSLGRSIAKGEYLYDDDVLAAVTVLATCELYEEINEAGGGWGKHVEGSNQLVAMRGPNSMQSDLALLLYSNMRHGSLLHALIERKAPFMATPEWRAVAYRVPKALNDASTTFYDSAIQIPGLLERHDALDLETPDALETLDLLLTDSLQLEDSMRDWYSAWQAIARLGCGDSTSDSHYYSLHPIEEFEVFCSLCKDRTLTQAYKFPDFLVAYLHSLYWMVMYYARTNTQSLQKQRHRLDHDWYPEPSRVVQEEELLGYILNLCRCIPFFVEPISSSTGSIGIFLPLRCAAMYFTAHGHWDWLRWIGDVRNSVFVKGLAPPNVKREGPPSAPCIGGLRDAR